MAKKEFNHTMYDAFSKFNHTMYDAFSKFNI